MSKYEVGNLVMFDDPVYGLQRPRVDAVRDDSLDASRPVRGDSRVLVLHDPVGSSGAGGTAGAGGRAVTGNWLQDALH